MSPICEKCGIRYEEENGSCPLCGKESEDPASKAGETGHSMKHFREVVTFTAFSAGLIVFITDFAYGGAFSWSRIPLLSLGYCWLTSFLLSFLHKGKYLPVPAAAASTGLFLFFLSGFTSPAGSWFTGMALPILAAVAAISVLAAAVIRLFGMSFLGTVSTYLAGAGLLTICIDFAVTPGASWSLVAASGVIPMIVFLAGLERRLRRKGSSLEKYFFT